MPIPITEAFHHKMRDYYAGDHEKMRSDLEKARKTVADYPPELTRSAARIVRLLEHFLAEGK